MGASFFTPCLPSVSAFPLVSVENTSPDLLNNSEMTATFLK